MDALLPTARALIASLATYAGAASTGWTAVLYLDGVEFTRDPVITSLGTAMACVFGCWIGSAATGYWSYVDRLWSITPPVYAITFALFSPSHPRLALMAALATVWGARLTANFARKGGYGDEEDYRWAFVRAWFAKHDPTHPLGREVFAFSFVALYQHILLWLLVGPACDAVLLHTAGSVLTSRDWALAAAFVILLGLETLTDEQQWAFQRSKHALTPAERSAAGGDFARGFCTSGVFAYSRHLNFVSEFSMWWVFAAFSLSSSHSLPPLLPFVGAALLTGLFMGSTFLTEELAASKYGAAYRAYQRTTSCLVPWLPGPSLDSPEGRRIIEACGGPVAVKAAPAAAAARSKTPIKARARSAARGTRKKTG